MRASRLPLVVFFASFSTFLIAFAAVLVLLRPAIQKKFAENQEAARQVSNASLAPNLGDTDRARHRRTTEESTEESVEESPEERETQPTEVRFQGQVLDEDGNPLPMAKVYVLGGKRRMPEGLRGRLLCTMNTDESGKFSKSASVRYPPIALVVHCGKNRFLVDKLPSITNGEIDLGRLTVTAPEPVRVIVRNDEGMPIPGASVEVSDPWEGPKELCRQTWSGTTDTLGRVLFNAADFGRYRVRVEQMGFATYVGLHHPRGSRFMEAEVTLATADAWIQGSVVDDVGGPAMQGEVVVRPLHAGFDGESYQAPIDEQGGFRVGPLPRGDYTVLAQIEGMTQRGEVVAEADGTRARLIVEYAGSASGSIEADALLPENAAVTLFRSDGRGSMVPFEGAFRAKVDPAAQTFRVDGIPPGTYQVRIGAGGFAPGRSAEFTLETGESRTGLNVGLSLHGGNIQGTILHTRGYPLGKVRVTAYEGRTPPSQALKGKLSESFAKTGATTSDGTFELEQLSPGAHFLTFEAAGLPARTLGPVNVDPQAPVRIGALVMGGGASLSGRALDSSGHTVSDARLILESLDDEGTWIPLLTEKGGTYCVRGLVQGRYRLTPASLSGLQLEQALVLEVAEDQAVIADLSLAAR